MSARDVTPSLVVRLRAGDANAARLLDEVYREAMVRFAWGYLGTLEEAEDAAQEIFAKVLRSATVPADLRVWLYRIARNHCLNVLRARGRRRDDARLPTGFEPGVSSSGALSRLVRAEDEEAVRRALASLAPEHAEVLRLRYGEGLDRAEIAAVLELPASLVKTRLYEGMKRLRESVRKSE